jgi:hypothetical protein
MSDMVTVAPRVIHLCPVCLVPVEKTRKEQIASHIVYTANNLDLCPTSGEPFAIAIKDGLPVMTFKRRERERLIQELRKLQERSAEIVDRLAMLDEQ